MKTHKDLEAWKNSIALVVKVYELSDKFPDHEKYGLKNQLRRAAVSIPSNIAEGAGRNHNKEFIQYLYVAQGSLAELETQFIISEELKYISEIELDEIMHDMNLIRSQIFGLIQYMKKK